MTFRAGQHLASVENTLETGGDTSRPNRDDDDFPEAAPTRELLRQRAERFEFDLLSSEVDDSEEPLGGRPPRIFRQRKPVKSTRHLNKWERAMHHYEKRKEDPNFDLPENYKVVVEAEGIKKFKVPSLRKCQRYLQNPETEDYNLRSIEPIHMCSNLVLNIISAFIIWCINMISLETVVVAMNAAGAAAYFDIYKEEWALKIDFSFLAFAIVFPLTFLIQSTFTRREQALSFLADFKSSLLTTALMTLSVDWPCGVSPSGGRLNLPDSFNALVVKDCRELIKLVYEYLSMPQVAHGRNHVIWSKQKLTKRVHALQNGIVQDINDYMYDFAMHTEEMKRYGFPSGEASRIHQYHQFMQQRFEHLRLFKYYRTPQSTRSFGRVYIFVLPWITGPYWAWMAEGTSTAFAIVISSFTFLVLLGLLNCQQVLEDPFLADRQHLMPGIDTIKLDFEMAVAIQTIEQYYANAELQREWELSQQNESESEQDVTKETLQENREEQTLETEALDRDAELIREEVLQSEVGIA